MKCRHQRNWTLTEKVDAWSEYSCHDGELDADGTSDATPTGIYTFVCHDCGLEKRVSKFSETCPAWLLNLIVTVETSR